MIIKQKDMYNQKNAWQAAHQPISAPSERQGSQISLHGKTARFFWRPSIRKILPAFSALGQPREAAREEMQDTARYWTEGEA
ncbi:hypothetical protein DPV78_008944 [Talaromyces pinophilus]|nr:hypothetical protein DPV78_008944 [Talaromyces pinophilus]